MATIKYTDLDGACPSTVWHGVRFDDGKTVTTEDQALIDAAKTNPWFTVSGDTDVSEDTPFERGADAAREDKKRLVPPAYRGKSEAGEWLEGYDSVKPQG